jgi:arginine/lysine/ornithine decarboxylase
MSRQVRSGANLSTRAPADAERAFISINGSAMRAHTGMVSVAGPGDEVLVARNGMSAAAALPAENLQCQVIAH